MKKSPLIAAMLCAALLGTSIPLLSSCGCQHPQMSEEIIPADCDSEGMRLHRCTECGYEYATDIVAPAGHQMQATVLAPTCEAQGYTVFRCSNCNYSYTADYIAPLTHQWEERAVAPTCTELGYTRHTCARCNYQYDDELIAPGHQFEVLRVPVTCTQSGYTEHICSTCTYSYKDYLHYTDLLPSAYAKSTEVLAKGLDVSKYNHKKNPDGSYAPLDWNAIKSAGFDYVIIKIGSTPRNDGAAGGLEPTFEEDYAGAKAAGLGVGVYFFTYAQSIEQNISDADLVTEWLAGKQLEYPIYYDIENNSFDDDPTDSILPTLPDRKVLTDYCVAFISRMQENGFYCGLYCNRDWLEHKLETARCTALFDIWYARYRDAVNPYPSTEVFTWTYGDPLGMWQYACTGTIEGFDNVYFDFNYCYKDFPSIMTEFGLNGY